MRSLQPPAAAAHSPAQHTARNFMRGGFISAPSPPSLLHGVVLPAMRPAPAQWLVLLDTQGARARRRERGAHPEHDSVAVDDVCRKHGGCVPTTRFTLEVDCGDLLTPPCRSSRRRSPPPGCRGPSWLGGGRPRWINASPPWRPVPPSSVGRRPACVAAGGDAREARSGRADSGVWRLRGASAAQRTPESLTMKPCDPGSPSSLSPSSPLPSGSSSPRSSVPVTSPAT